MELDTVKVYDNEFFDSLWNFCTSIFTNVVFFSKVNAYNIDSEIAKSFFVVTAGLACNLTLNYFNVRWTYCDIIINCGCRV